MTTIKINVYRAGSEWFGARRIDGEYDGCDALDLPADSTDEDAIRVAQEMPLAVEGEREVCRVADA